MYDNIIELEELAEKTKKMSTEVYIMQCLRDYDIRKWGNLTLLQRKQLFEWAYEMWCKQEMNLDISCICETTMENRKDILAGRIDKWKFFDLLERWR